MPYSVDVHNACRVVDRVDDAIVTHTDTPEVGGALELDASSWPWIRGQSLDARDDALGDSRFEFFELPANRLRNDNRVLSHAEAVSGGSRRVS